MLHTLLWVHYGLDALLADLTLTHECYSRAEFHKAECSHAVNCVGVPQLLPSAVAYQLVV
jgi:hypothetical protein